MKAALIVLLFFTVAVEAYVADLITEANVAMITDLQEQVNGLQEQINDMQPEEVEECGIST